MAGSIEHYLGALSRLHSDSLTVCSLTKEKDLVAYYEELCKQFAVTEGGGTKRMRKDGQGSQ